MVVLARGRFNPRKQAQRLVFGGGGWWCWPEEGPTTENELVTARFQGLWVVVAFFVFAGSGNEGVGRGCCGLDSY